ncbi:MAG: hypothetical protein ACLFQM_11485 [Fidelibacterota bacterium]
MMIRNIAIIKTKKEHLRGVKVYHMHATKGKITKLQEGDLILIDITDNTLDYYEKPIQYCMEFVGCNKDKDNLSDKIWGEHWEYIVSGKNLIELEKPFNLDKIKRSNKNYSKGVFWMAYLEDIDIEYLYDNGYLRPRT